jgi:hypothetical protein
MTDFAWAILVSTFILAPLRFFSVIRLMTPVIFKLKKTVHDWRVASNDETRQQCVLSLSRQSFELSALLCIPLVWVCIIVYAPILMHQIQDEGAYYWFISGILLVLSMALIKLPRIKS